MYGNHWSACVWTLCTTLPHFVFMFCHWLISVSNVSRRVFSLFRIRNQLRPHLAEDADGAPPHEGGRRQHHERDGPGRAHGLLPGLRRHAAAGNPPVFSSIRAHGKPGRLREFKKRLFPDLEKNCIPKVLEKSWKCCYNHVYLHWVLNN